MSRYNFQEVYYATYSRARRDMFDSNHASFFNESKRIRIIHFILKRKRFSNDPSDDFAFGLDKLIQLEVYSDAYPVHDGTIHEKGRLKVRKGKIKLQSCFLKIFILDSKRSKLYKEWGLFRKWYKYQPLDAIRKYFGVKIGLYFAWLGFFTTMLIFPSIAGMIVFLYGFLKIGDDEISRDVCEGAMSDTVMCPVCDPCNFWRLGEACDMTRYNIVTRHVTRDMSS